MARKINLLGAALVVGLLCASAASATEIITYTYDARGRLIKVVHSGDVNTNNQACYQYDKADNRTKVTTTVGTPCT